jgi:hypothetical protein
MKEALEKAIKSAAEKAAESKSADDAQKFAQSALNSAHALATLSNIKLAEGK